MATQFQVAGNTFTVTSYNRDGTVNLFRRDPDGKTYNFPNMSQQQAIGFGMPAALVQAAWTPPKAGDLTPTGANKVVQADGSTQFATRDNQTGLASATPAPVTGTGTNVTVSPVETSAGSPINVQQYLRANPDIAAAFASGDPQYVPPQYKDDINAYAAWHYNTHGKGEGRPLQPAAGVTDAQIEEQFQTVYGRIQQAAQPQYDFSAPNVEAFGGVGTDLTPEQQAQLQAMRNGMGDGAATPEDIAALERQFVTENQASHIGFGDVAYGAGDGGSEYVDPFAKMSVSTRNSAIEYQKKNPNATPYEVMKGIGLTDQDIAALQARQNAVKASDPKVKDEAAISNLVGQMNPDAYKPVADQARQKPDELVRQMAGDLARYGISDLRQLGSYQTATGDTVYFNKANGEVLPDKFGSDMSGKGGKGFTFQTTENGVVVPVPSWVDTSNNEEISMALTAVAMAVAPYAAPYVEAATGSSVAGAAAAGGVVSGAGGIPYGLETTLERGTTGAAVAGLTAGLGEYTGFNDWLAAQSGAVPVSDATINYTPGNGPGNALTGTPLPAAPNYTSPNYSLGTGNGGQTGLTGSVSDNGLGFQGLPNGGQTGLTPSTAPGLGLLNGGTGLLATTPNGTTVGAGGPVTTNPGLSTNLANDPANASADSNFPQQGSGTPQQPTPGERPPPSDYDPAGPAAPPAGSGPSLTDIIRGVGAGAAVVGTVGGLVTGDPETPDAQSVIDANNELVRNANDIAWAELDFRKEQYNWLKPFVEQQLNTGQEVSQFQLDEMRKASGRSDQQWQQYLDTFVPLEQKMASEAMAYGDKTDQERQAGSIAADTQAQLSRQREITARQNASVGFDPSSGRQQATQRTQDVIGAGLSAVGQNQAREATRDKGISLRAGAAGFGRNQVNSAGQNIGLGSNIGSSATSSAGAGIGSGASLAGVVTPGFSAVQNATQMGINNNLSTLQIQNNQAALAAANDPWSKLAKAGGSLLGLF